MWATLIPAIGSLLGGIFGGHKQKQAAQQASHGARLQDILPMLMPLIQQQQQHNAQTFGQQQQQYQQIQPLQQSLATMAQRLMPRQ